MARGSGRQKMGDIARLAGVSTPTVSRALNDSPLVTEETKKKILEIARQQGYVVNRIAQNLRKRRTGTIAVVLDFPSMPEQRISDPFLFELLGNITNAVATRQQDVLLCSSQSAHSGGLAHMHTNKGVDGIIVVGQAARHEELRELARVGAAFVVWGASQADAPYCIVGSDNLDGGRQVAHRFKGMNRERPVFVGPVGHAEIDQRLQGFRAAFGQDIEQLQVPDFSFAASRDALLARLDSGSPPPDAVFAGSDTMAMGVLAALGERGIAVPAQCTVCGYDDNPGAAHQSPPLTTIRQDTRMAGAILVDRLMQVIEGARPASVRIPTELIVRGS